MDTHRLPGETRSVVIRVAAVAVAGLLWLAPVKAEASSSATFDDPIGDVTYYAPDLGATTVTAGDDDVFTVDTRIVPRPPANWGGCAYYVGFPPYQTCVPADMNVTWYFDYQKGAGSIADDGADAKVVAVPSRGQTFWESDRWDSANGRFSAGAKPVATEDSGGVRWSLRLVDLGIPKPATVRAWAVSLYKSYNGLGTLLNYSDTAGPGTLSIGGVSGNGTPAASSSCARATGRVNKLQRKIRSAKRRAHKGRRSARKRLRRLRAQRRRALRKMKRRCGPIAKGPPPSAAPPGCRLVTKTVLKQEGIGIYAKWVLEPEVVVDCSK
jgi:hypothetical protein